MRQDEITAAVTQIVDLLAKNYVFPDVGQQIGEVLNGVYHRSTDSIQQFWTQSYLPSPRYGPDRPVAVLTSATTFSGAEELAFDLQEQGRATIVGEVTRGGAHPREAFGVHPHLEATIAVARSVSPLSGTNWEGTGVRPDIEVPADQALARALAHLQATLT